MMQRFAFAYVLIKIFLLFLVLLAFLKKISSQTAPDNDLVIQYKTRMILMYWRIVPNAIWSWYTAYVYKYLKHPENAQDSVIAIFEELIVKLKRLKWRTLRRGCIP